SAVLAVTVGLLALVGVANSDCRQAKLRSTRDHGSLGLRGGDDWEPERATRRDHATVVRDDFAQALTERDRSRHVDRVKGAQAQLRSEVSGSLHDSRRGWHAEDAQTFRSDPTLVRNY